MVNTYIPKITQDLVEMIKLKAEEGTYRVDVTGIPIDVFPYIFPPQSQFSESTHTVYDQFGNLTGKDVLDVGTGTGIQAIQAALAGAQTVDAIDIYDSAVECAKHNIKLNGLGEKIKVWQSDLFNTVPKKEYGLIIANLPILDSEQEDLRLYSLFDPNFLYHGRLFNQASNYLSRNGKITLCHSNLQEDGFCKLEEIARKNGFASSVKQIVNSLGYEWRNYEFSLKNKDVEGGNK